MVRKTTVIGIRASRSLYYATHEQAERIGTPLNLFVTINFSLAGFKPEDAVAVFAQLRTGYFGPWVRRPRTGCGASAAPTYVYAFENVRANRPINEESDDHNVHVHWPLYVPGQRKVEFMDKVHDWMDTLAAKRGLPPCPDGTIYIDSITDERGGTRGMRNYILKGAADAVAGHFGATAYPQGLIHGTRAGTSRNLGNAARRAQDRELGKIRRVA